MKHLIKLVPNWFYALVKAVSTMLSFNRNYAVYLSLRERRSVDHMGRPVPWFTYPAIEYLRSFDLTNRSLFEYGAGQSTLYWSSRCESVTAVEHDKKWFDQVRFDIGGNVKIFHEEEKEKYVDAIAREGREYNVIVVDGMWRMECSAIAIKFLANDGMIILDNADWYPDIVFALRTTGFLQIDFSGFAPLNRFVSTTSIFFRREANLQENFGILSPRGGRRGGALLESIETSSPFAVKDKTRS